MSDSPKPHVPDKLLDALFKHYEKPEDFFGSSGILEQLTKLVVERALQAELSHHLGHEKHGTVMSQHGNIEIDVPRDRQGRFEPQLVQKHQTHWQGFDDTVREIQGHLLSGV